MAADATVADAAETVTATATGTEIVDASAIAIRTARGRSPQKCRKSTA
jgi:hypothetical protein